MSGLALTEPCIPWTGKLTNRIAPEDLNAYVNRHTRGAVLRPVRRRA